MYLVKEGTKCFVAKKSARDFGYDQKTLREFVTRRTILFERIEHIGSFYKEKELYLMFKHLEMFDYDGVLKNKNLDWILIVKHTDVMFV